jgi:hypothetical protein
VEPPYPRAEKLTSWEREWWRHQFSGSQHLRGRRPDPGVGGRRHSGPAEPAAAAEPTLPVISEK